MDDSWITQPANEYHLDSKFHRVSLHSLADHVITYDLGQDRYDYDIDAWDDLMDELNRMTLNEFINKYPKTNSKIFAEKIVPQKIIAINYHFPLLYPITKLYKDETGFSINAIARNISREYKNFYQNHKNAMERGTTPKYLPKNVISREELNIRFSFKEGDKNSACYDVPLIHVGVDT